MNLILGDVEETIFVVDVPEDGGAETVRVCLSSRSRPLSWPTRRCAHLLAYSFPQTVKRNSEMLFVRGDSVILVRSLTALALILIRYSLPSCLQVSPPARI